MSARRVYHVGQEVYHVGQEVYLVGQEVYHVGQEVYHVGQEVYHVGQEVYSVRVSQACARLYCSLDNNVGVWPVLVEYLVVKMVSVRRAMRNPCICEY